MIFQWIGLRATALLVFIIILGTGYVFSEYIQGTIEFPFTITETGQQAMFSMSLGDLLEILTWSFGLVIAGYFLVSVNMEKWERHALLSPRKKDILFSAFVIAALLIASGNIVHVFFNQFNGMVDAFASTNALGLDLFVLVYFIDEHVSHAMIHIGIMIILGVVLASEPVEQLPGDVTNAKAKTTMFTMLLGFSMGAIQALAAFEGQCGLIVLVISLVMLVAVLVLHYLRGARSFDTIRPFERPNLGFFFCFVIAATLVSVLWGLIFGLLPAYPFFQQPGEVL
jgi:hypothetical protein